MRCNRLLAALPQAGWLRWRPHLVPFESTLGQMICESGAKLSHVHFPTTAIVSLLDVMEKGASAEIAVVGNEGLVGIPLFMGGESTSSRAVVRSAGKGYLKDEFHRGGPVLHLWLRYIQALITQMSHTAVCSRHHSLDQQLCRWLLLSLDRLQGDELVMTQDLIANMLGVRREGVTMAALELPHAGVIHSRAWKPAWPGALAADEPRPLPRRPLRRHPRVPGRHARIATRRHHARRRRVAEGGPDRTPTR